MCQSSNHSYVSHWENKLRAYAKHIGLEDKEFIESQLDAWRETFDPNCKDRFHASDHHKGLTDFSGYVKHLKETNDDESLKYMQEVDF